MDVLAPSVRAAGVALASIVLVACSSPRPGGATAEGTVGATGAPPPRAARRAPRAAEGSSSAAATKRVVVVELFSSEGCSSCPPADAVLAELSGAARDDGTVVVGLEHHVDYWDRLGWKDPFSTADATERQSRYARGGDSIFTPQAVVDGVTSLVGSRRAALDEAIRARAEVEPIPMRARLDGDRAVHVEIDAAPARASDLFVAVTESGLSTAVPAGENAGETLRHGPIVRWLERAGSAEVGAFDVALDVTARGGARTVVAFVQSRPQGEILGAAIASRGR